MKSKTIFPGSRILLTSDEKLFRGIKIITADKVKIKMNLFTNCFSPSYRFIIDCLFDGRPGRIYINSYKRNPFAGYYGLTLGDNFTDYGKYFINNQNINEKEFINYVNELLLLKNKIKEENDKNLMNYFHNLSINTYGYDIFKEK